MVIVFDLDNTLVDEFGKTLRPGTVRLLKNLKKDNHSLILWTNSTKERTYDILRIHKLKTFFSKVIAREDYDPKGKDGCKNIEKVKGNLLIDDNPEQKAFAKSKKYKVIIVKPYLSYKHISEEDFINLYDEIKKLDKSVVNKLKRLFK